MDLLENLNPQQREAVTHKDGPLLILAGAGSGKTRVLTRRIAYLLQQGVDPYRILAITFTNKAAREMKERLRNLVGPMAESLWVSTFHAAALRILRREAERVGLGSNFVVLDTADQRTVIRDCLKELNLSEKRWPPAQMLGSISKAKNALQDADSFARQAGNFYEHQVAEVYKRYQARLFANNAVDFDDLIMLAVRVLQNHPGVAERYARRFEHVMVDEYQDTNHAQYRLVRYLTAVHGNLMVVGDSDQSIYGWRGRPGTARDDYVTWDALFCLLRRACSSAGLASFITCVK